MVNIYLENAIREFVVACFMSRVDRRVNNGSVVPELAEVMTRGGKLTFGAMTGLSDSEVKTIFKDELQKIGRTLQRKKHLLNAQSQGFEE